MAELDSSSEDLRYGVVSSDKAVWLVEKAETSPAHTPSFDEAKETIRPRALRDAQANVCACVRCGAFTVRGEDPCALCTDATRDGGVVCVVEEAADVVTIESSGAFRGRYHVLAGKLSPVRHCGPDKLRIAELKDRIERVSMMGGGLLHGNWTPAAEFNILVDPEAAKIVYESGIPIYMAGLDVTEKALVFPEDFERIRAVGNKVAEVVADWLEFFYGFHRKLGYPGAPVHDAVAVAALIKPEIMTFKDLYVQVETAGDYCKGTTVGDWYGVTGKAPNASCILDIDRQGFVDLLVEAVKTYA